jgi:hypothetical protein
MNENNDLLIHGLRSPLTYTWDMELLSYETRGIQKLNPWRRVILEKLIFTQLVKKTPAFYVTGMFIVMYIIARHESSPHLLFPRIEVMVAEWE